MGPRHSKLENYTDPLEKQQMKNQKRLEDRRKFEKAKKEALKNSKKKKSRKSVEKQLQQQQQQQQSEVSNIYSNETMNFNILDYNQIALMKLKEQICSNIPSFLLNQIILSVQFFGNFEIEKRLAIQRLTKKEFELNQKLENYSVILTNAIDDAVDKRVRFQARHGPEKHKSYPLQLQTVYMVYESVQVYDPKYDHVQPVCRVDIDTSLDIVGDDKVRKGYVRLEIRDNNKKRDTEKTYDTIYSRKNQSLSTVSSLDSLYESESNTDTTYGVRLRRKQYQRQKIYENHCEKEIYEHSDTTSAYASNSETDYEYILNLNTHQPLCSLTKSNENESSNSTVNNSILPESCITLVQHIINDDNYSTYSDLDDDGNRRSEIKYLNSKQFFSYFINIFIERLANILDITENELNLATWKFSSIFTAKFEIIPAIHIQNWPECAKEWIKRSRQNYKNPVNDKLVQWPTPEMIKQVCDYGCYVIPQGYIQKYQQNPTRELEWKIVFPKAEKYLESCLTSTQIKIFMICKTLIKTFIESNSEMNGIYMFTIEHLRMHLFWECEKNFLAWNEEYLGERLIRFLKSFIRRLSKKSLPDYFIRNRNLFECIPDRYKNQLLIILTHIVENPVIYMIKAFKNLHQIKLFHAKLNYNNIYTGIVVDDLINFVRQIKCCIKSDHIDEILSQGNDNKNKKNEINLEESDSENENGGGLIAYHNRREKLDEIKQRKTKKLKFREARKIKKRLEREMEKRPSEDSIDLKFILPERLSKIQRSTKKETENIRRIIDNMRSVLLTEIFINHFIQMSKNMYELESYDLVKIYLNQAERLCQILIDYDYSHDGYKYKDKIKSLHHSFKNNQTYRLSSSIINSKINPLNDVPELPSRTNLQPAESFNKNLIKIQSQNLHYIEPNLFEPDIDEEITLKSSTLEKTTTKIPRSTSIKFQVSADIHVPNSISKSETNVNHGILKSSSKREFDFSKKDIVEIRNTNINKDRTNVRSITLAKDDDDEGEISESRL